MLVTASADSMSANRLRSGSLTLADNGVGSNSGNGFGSVFYSGAAPRSQLNQVLGSKDLRMITSHTSSNGSSGADEYVTFSTMDYLGLGGADNSETPRATTFGFEKGPAMPSASNSQRLQAQAQAQAQASASQTTAATSSANRNRANTVSNYTRPAYKSASSFQDLISAANLGEDRDPSRPIGLYDDYSRYNMMPTLSGSGLDGYAKNPTTTGSADIKGFKDSALLNSLSRPRATTIGMLDSPNLRNAIAAGGLAHNSHKVGSSVDIGGYADAYDNASSAPFVPTTRNDRGFASMHQAIAPRHNASQSISSNFSVTSGLQDDGLSRSGGKGAANNLSADNQGQQPTRSLWLGNLDVMTTTNDLMQVFAQYGTIESLRLLPEKVSADWINILRKNLTRTL
jgi:protein JSN1